MSEQIPNPLSEVMRALGSGEAKRDERFENKCVQYLLSEFKLTKHAFSITERQRKLTGSRLLTLHQFAEEFPDFPISLASAKIPSVEVDTSVARLFNSFRTLKIVQKYEELAELIPKEQRHKPFGLIIAWSKINRGLLLHDMSTALSENGFRMYWKNNRVTLCLEPLKTFVERQTWRPTLLDD